MGPHRHNWGIFTKKTSIYGIQRGKGFDKLVGYSMEEEVPLGDSDQWKNGIRRRLMLLECEKFRNGTGRVVRSSDLEKVKSTRG